MHMTFWWDTNIPDLLFYGCNISTKGLLVLTCLLLIGLGIFFEWLKLLQARQRQRELVIRAKQIRTVCPPTETSTLIRDEPTMSEQKPSIFVRINLILWDACLWINIQVLGYVLMLIIMVYNGWLIISLLIGSGIGYFLFGTHFVKITIQNCQTIRETFCYINCVESDSKSKLYNPIFHLFAIMVAYKYMLRIYMYSKLFVESQTSETTPVIQPTTSHCSSNEHGQGIVAVCVHSEPT